MALLAVGVSAKTYFSETFESKKAWTEGVMEGKEVRAAPARGGTVGGPPGGGGRVVRRSALAWRRPKLAPPPPSSSPLAARRR